MHLPHNSYDEQSLSLLALKVSDHISAMLAYWDQDLICRFANAAYLEWFGKTREEMIGIMTLPALLGPIYYQNLPYIAAALQGQAQTFERELTTPEGEHRHSLANYYPDIDPQTGHVNGFFVHVANITPLKALERANITAKKQNIQLINFANIVAHNLRNYSNGFWGLLSLIDLDKVPQDQVVLLNHVKHLSENFIETINSLNELLNIQNSETTNLEKIDLNKYIHKSLVIMNQKISINKVIIDLEVHEQLYCWGIHSYIESIFTNLISNAVKYRRPDNRPMICISAQATEDTILICVADNGVGIDLEKHGSKIFGLYQKFHENQDAQGIGLYITKMQVEAMEGQIWLESEVGRGTSFFIQLQRGK